MIQFFVDFGNYEYFPFKYVGWGIELICQVCFPIKVFEAPITYVYGMLEMSVPKALEVKVEVALAFEV